MIMALLNNDRERTTILEAGKPEDFSVINQFLASNIENSSFDMEKYLRRTEEGAKDTKFESFFNHEDISMDWHKSLYKQEHQIIPTEDMPKSKPGKEKQHLERECEGNCPKDLSCNTTSSKKKSSIGSLDPYLEVESNTNDNFQSKQLASIAPGSKERSGCAEIPWEEHVTKITHVGESWLKLFYKLLNSCPDSVRLSQLKLVHHDHSQSLSAEHVMI